VTSSANPIPYGTCVDYTATVVLGDGVSPSGDVTFSGTLGTAALVETAAGTWTATSSSVCGQTPGSHTVTATYSGAGQGTSHGTVSQVVTAAATSVTISAPGGTFDAGTTDTTFGQAVLVTVTSATGPTTTGKVTVQGTSDPSTLTISLVGGVATIPAVWLKGGVYSLNASYGGATSFHTSSTTAPFALDVAADTDSLSLTATASGTHTKLVPTLTPDKIGTVGAGGSYTFEGQVAPGGPWATLDVLGFTGGGATVSWNAPNAAIAPYSSLRVVYNGDPNFAGATSPSIPA
jgi:hypothetical protein